MLPRGNARSETQRCGSGFSRNVPRHLALSEVLVGARALRADVTGGASI